MAQFSSRHYITLAKILNGQKPVKMDIENQGEFDARLKTWDSIVNKMTQEFLIDNPKFSSEKFTRACCEDKKFLSRLLNYSGTSTTSSRFSRIKDVHSSTTSMIVFKGASIRKSNKIVKKLSRANPLDR